MKKIGRVMLVIGVILILIPIVGRVYVGYRQKQLYEEYLKTISRMQEQTTREEETEQTPEVSPGEPAASSEGEAVKEEAWEVPKNIKNDETIGRIMIDKIDLNLLLLEGVDNGALGMGAGHMPETALPGQSGNCVIAGHRNYTFGSMFNRLDEVAVGDEIVVELEGRQFTYTVTETKIIDPDDLSVTDQNEEIKELTLITCHPVYSSAHRLIIKGELLE